MNWAKYLMIGMGLFMAFILSMGIYMLTRTEDDHDVHYYEKGLNYDADYQRKQQVEADKARPVVTVNGGLLIKFRSPAMGRLILQRPADRKLDRTYSIESSGHYNMVQVPAVDLRAGPWQMRIEWESGAKHYLVEQEVIMP